MAKRIILLVACAIALTSPLAEARVSAGKPPPESLGTRENGDAVGISQFRGKVVVVALWASWCTYCLHELPILENLQRKAGHDRLEVVAVNVDRQTADYEKIKAQMRDFQLTMTVDAYHHVWKDYGASALPFMLIIDKKGVVSRVNIGYSKQMLPGFVDDINRLLAEDDTG